MKLRRPLAVVVATVAALGLFAAPAYADSYGPIKSSCSGTRLASWDLVSGMTIFGRTELWYSSANGGQNCVVTYTNSPGAWTEVHLLVDDNDNRTVDSTDRGAGDSGYYNSYAGASYLNNTDGHCVKVIGSVAPRSGGSAGINTPFRNCG
ncbi:hypothetical protein [Promicromonospora panici]|uniref:hypothetical protein n=1 Tax=Promicromonospora panici TaxID=2219658 RepID=UPI00101B817D|nr:hypothetical protein [Promicromonospora panici]